MLQLRASPQEANWWLNNLPQCKTHGSVPNFEPRWHIYGLRLVQINGISFFETFHRGSTHVPVYVHTICFIEYYLAGILLPHEDVYASDRRHGI